MERIVPTQDGDIFTAEVVCSSDGELSLAPLRGDPGVAGMRIMVDLTQARGLNPKQSRSLQGAVMDFATEIVCGTLSGSRPRPPTLSRAPKAPPVNQQAMANAIGACRRSCRVIGDPLDELAYEALAQLTDEALLIEIVGQFLCLYPWRFLESAINKICTTSALKTLRSIVAEALKGQIDRTRDGIPPFEDDLNCQKALALIDARLAGTISPANPRATLLQNARRVGDDLDQEAYAILEAIHDDASLAAIAQHSIQYHPWKFVQKVLVRIQSTTTLKKLQAYLVRLDEDEEQMAIQGNYEDRAHLSEEHINRTLAAEVLIKQHNVRELRELQAAHRAAKQ